MKTSLKADIGQIFSCCLKNLGCPKFGGAAAPLAPPGPYAFGINRVRYIFHLLRFTKLKTMRALAMELSQLNTTIHNYKVEIYK